MTTIITPLPTPPTRQDSANFNDRADDFLGSLPLFQQEANALAIDVQSSADGVEIARQAVASVANVTKWVSGTTYAQGAAVWSPINGVTYRKMTSTTGGTTDPSLDSANYKSITDAAGFTYQPAGTSAVTTTVQAKLRETVSVKDFGASGDGITNDDTAFSLAEAESDEIYLPEGTYILTSVPTKKYYGPGTVVVSGTTYLPASAAQDIGSNNTIVGRGAGILVSTGSLNTLVGFAAGRNITTGTKNVYVGINGGSGNVVLDPVVPMTGTDNIGIGYHAIKKCQSGSFNVGIGTDAGNEITTGDGNTCLGGSAGQQVTIGNDNTLAGRSAALRLGTDASANPTDPATWVAVGGTGNTIMGRDALRNGYDCDYNTVIGFGAMRGTQSETSFTGNITGDFNIAIGYRAAYTNPTSLASNVIIGGEAGRDVSTGSSNVMIGAQAGRDVEGSNNVIIGPLVYRNVTSADNKIVISNHSGTGFIDGTCLGGGNVENILTFDALVRPGSDNNRQLGTASRRWSEVFAGSGTINTSDSRTKEVREEGIDEAVLRAWGKVNYAQFKFKDAIVKKGNGARWHIGVIAQQVKEAFESEGLDPLAYGILCHDKWDAEYEPIMEERTVTFVTAEGVEETYSKFFDTGEKRLVREAGDLYGIRYEESLALECAYLRSKLA